MLPDELGLPEGVEPFPLSGAGLRNFLLTNVSPDEYATTSGAELLDFLRLNGVRINTNDFYDIRAGVLYLSDKVDSLRRDLDAIAPQYGDALVPLGYTIFDHGYSLSSDYLYRFEIVGHNPLTGEATSEFIAVGADAQMSFNEAADLAGSYISAGLTSGGNLVDDVKLDAAFGRPEIFV